MYMEDVVIKMREFNRFYTNIISVLDQSVLNSGYSLAEARVLYEIGRIQPCSARLLMESINIDEGYLSRILNVFAKRGFLVRIQSEEDKRIYEITLSEKGILQLDNLNAIANQSNKKLIEKLTVSQLADLIKSMKTISKVLTQHNHVN